MATRWLVDGMNLIGARPDGWWRDKPAAMQRLIEELRDFASDSGDSVVVVFDFRPKGMRPGARDGVKVRFADGGPQAADRMIAEIVTEDPGFTVVTSDRPLRQIAEAAGAAVVGAGSFRDRMDL